METVLSRKQRKMLRKIIKATTPEKIVLDVREMESPFNLIDLEYLIDQGLVNTPMKHGIPVLFSLTPIGASYFDRNRADTWRFIKRSIAVPIFVSAVTSVITIWVTQLLTAK